MSELIKVTLTPAITLQLETTEDLWVTAFNADEFEDVILNLVLNARDAMPDGGNLLIETSNKVLDADYARRNPRLEAGDYVLISVSDNGTGMDEEVVTHLFDPFFTTKEAGKGSGLGLSMVYGFAQRSGGHIKVYTNPGHGSTFRLYLPRLIDADAIALTNKPAVVALPHGTETVLVVEDEAELREIARAHLQLLGYHVISAENAMVALQILQSRAAEIDLVFSDVVMPGGMGGFELAQEVKTRWPQIKVLMTSGFTDRAAKKSNGLAKLQTTLLEKPYSERELAIALRDLLNSTTLQS